MSEAFLLGVFVAFGLVVCLWIFIYKRLLLRLKQNHPQRYALMYGSHLGRHNSMDSFFAFLRFVLMSEDRALQDRVVSAQVVLLKLLFAAAFVLMITSALGPFFLSANWN